MSFLFSWFKLTICLVNIIWTNTTVEVPLNDDINDYIEIPQAKVYQDGVLIEDAIAYYQTNGVNRTFLSTVNTSYVKSYYIYYEVFFEAYDIRDVQQIEFLVVDITPPVITHLPSFIIDFGEKLPIFIDHLRYEDDYDEVDLLSVDIDISKINQSMVGSYEIIVSITDTSLNKISEVTTLSILDRKAPEIILDKPIILDVGLPYKIGDFITIKDNYDLNITPKVLDHELNLYALGDYEITVIATDMSKNIAMETFLVTVVDRTPPVLILKSYPEPIAVNTNMDDLDLLAYVISLSDNYDEMDISDLTFYHDIDVSRVGSYKIYYKVSDQSLNVYETELVILVVDQEKPMIEITKPFIFEVFSNPVNLYDHFVVTDNYCSVDDLKITITTAYKLNIIGTYDISIEITDLYKNKTTYRGVVEVIDLVPPEIIEITDIIITDFKTKDLTIYFDAIDQYDGKNVDLYIDDSGVNYEQIGVYNLYVYASDQSLNQTIYQSSVMIIDITAPILELNIYQLHIDVFEQHEDLLSYIKEAYDNYDDISINDILIDGNIDINKVGAYEIIYSLKDYSFNETIQVLKVFVNDDVDPTIVGNDLNVDMYETIDLLEGLIIEDNVGVYNIYYDPELINTAMPGSYEISYLVMDESGNTAEFTRTIYINEMNQPYDLKSFIPIIVTTMLSVSILYYLYKKI